MKCDYLMKELAKKQEAVKNEYILSKIDDEFEVPLSVKNVTLIANIFSSTMDNQDKTVLELIAWMLTIKQNDKTGNISRYIDFRVKGRRDGLVSHYQIGQDLLLLDGDDLISLGNHKSTFYYELSLFKQGIHMDNTAKFLQNLCGLYISNARDVDNTYWNELSSDEKRAILRFWTGDRDICYSSIHMQKYFVDTVAAILKLLPPSVVRILYLYAQTNELVRDSVDYMDVADKLYAIAEGTE